MGAEMTRFNWTASIVAGVELAGIELGTTLEGFESSLREFCVDSDNALYKFPEAPLFVLKVSESSGELYFRFDIFDLALTGWSLQFPGSPQMLSETRALVVVFVNGRISNVSVWMFDYFDSLGDKKLTYSYQGFLNGGVKLGSRVDCAASIFDLLFDEGEEWFCSRTDKIIFGGGGGGDLEDSEDQLIHMIMIF